MNFSATFLPYPLWIVGAQAQVLQRPMSKHENPKKICIYKYEYICMYL